MSNLHPALSSSLLPLPRAVRRLMDAHRRRKSLQQILHLDDRTLSDIGLTRAQVFRALDRHTPLF
jgi:uncharacterized protein YjiS (DUF1127 family)